MAGTHFHSKTTGLDGRVFGGATMMEVLQRTAGGGGYAELGSYVAAALLNSPAGKTPFLSQPVIRKMWNDVLSKGSFSPTVGVNWGVADVTRYLRSTMR